MTNSSSAGASYDEVPYESQAFHESHPDHLATIARLHGLEPVPIDNCRILEIGCASGGNLIPMALALPDAYLLGVDLSAGQIATGNEIINRIGLKNLELRAQSFTDLDATEQPFDYIIAHGIFSWIPEQQRQELLNLCAKKLSPSGVAFISYNAYPGWHALQMLREIMLFRAQSLKDRDPLIRVAEIRGFLNDLAQSMPEPQTPYGTSLRVELSGLRDRADSYILHEYLEEENQPFTILQFLALAKEHKLQYLSDARARASIHNQPPNVRAFLDRYAGDDIPLREQCLDYLRNRTFRRSLLVHDQLDVLPAPSPSALENLLFQAAAAPVSPVIDFRSNHAEEFRTQDGKQRINTADPLVKSALFYLFENWPRAVPFSELHARALDRLEAPSPSGPAAPFDRQPRSLANALLPCYYNGVVELHTWEAPFTMMPGHSPAASPYAVLQAQTSNKVTNLYHRVIELTAFERLVLKHLDGQHDRDALLSALVAATLAGDFPLTRDGLPLQDAIEVRAILDRSLDPCLQRLYGAALVMS